jgi:hypothetical protein
LRVAGTVEIKARASAPSASMLGTIDVRGWKAKVLF